MNEADKQPLKGCSVIECWHHVTLPNNKCLCSNPCDGRTGEPGCIGYRQPYGQVKNDKEFTDPEWELLLK